MAGVGDGEGGILPESRVARQLLSGRPEDLLNGVGQRRGRFHVVERCMEADSATPRRYLPTDKPRSSLNSASGFSWPSAPCPEVSTPASMEQLRRPPAIRIWLLLETVDERPAATEELEFGVDNSQRQTARLMDQPNSWSGPNSME